MPECRFHQRLRRRLAVFFLQIFFQRTGIDTDADRYALVARAIDHGAYPICLADVARIDAQAIDTVIRHFQRDAVIEMDVGHQGHWRTLLDQAKRFGSVHGRHRHAHDVGTGICQLDNLRDCRVDIGGFGIGHALHADRRITTDQDIADADLPRFPAHDPGLTFHAAVRTLAREAAPCGATSPVIRTSPLAR